MRRHALSLIPALVSSPLFAQAPRIAPAASALFATAPAPIAQDTVRVDTGMPQGEGAFLGMLGGAGVGYLLARVLEGGGDCTQNSAGGSGNCGPSDPAKGRLGSALVGATVGLFVGSEWAGPHPPRPIFVPATREDSLRLARRKGGKLGAIVGGVIAGGTAGVLAAQSGSEPICDAIYPQTCQGGDGFDGAAVMLATGAGALVGYVMGRSIPARRPNPRPQLEAEHPPVRDTGMKWWQGALVGGVIGGVGAPMLVKTLRLDQQGGDVPAIAFAPLGALLGLVIGGSVAQAH